MAWLPKFFPNDLVGEILSALPVKSILRFRCVNKYCDNLIYDPIFVNPHSIHIPGESPYGSDDGEDVDEAFIPYSLCRLFENPSFSIEVDPYYVVKNHEYRLIGSCNGLICFGGESVTREYHEYWFRLWNPATRTTSAKFGTYKLVASRYNKRQLRSNVKILSLGDSIWRDIGSFPVDPLNLNFLFVPDMGVYLKSTFNWLAIQNKLWYVGNDYKDINVEQCFIVSLDLRTETYNQYLLPHDFEEMPPVEPVVSVLGDYLCFSYCNKESDFVIWKMEKFGVEYSWTQFIKISNDNLQIDYDFSDEYIKFCHQLEPLFLSEDGDTLILDSRQESPKIIYNWRVNRVERTKIVASRTTNDDP